MKINQFLYSLYIDNITDSQTFKIWKIKYKLQTFIHWSEGSNRAPNEHIVLCREIKTVLRLTRSVLTVAHLSLDYSDIAERTPWYRTSLPPPHFEGLFSALPNLNCKTTAMMIWKHTQHSANNLKMQNLHLNTSNIYINIRELHVDKCYAVFAFLFWKLKFDSISKTLVSTDIYMLFTIELSFLSWYYIACTSVLVVNQWF